VCELVLKTMKIIEFLKGLLPSFGKDRVVEDLRITKGEVESLIPVYSEAASLLKNVNFKSKEIQALVSIFKRVNGGGSENIVVTISKGLSDVLANIDVVAKIADTDLRSNVAGMGLTFKQATVIRYTDSLYLLTKYAREFLHFVYTYESAEYKANSLEAKESVTPADFKWLQQSINDFAIAFQALTDDPKKTLTKFESIPDMVASTTDESVVKATVGLDKVDPHRFLTMGFTYNPIYKARMVYAEWQVRRYKVSKMELETLQLRKMHLEKVMKNQNDAAIEKQIQYLEGRIQGLKYDMAEMEGKA
jgi:hypothetical protein